jgi:hypothetical protein
VHCSPDSSFGSPPPIDAGKITKHHRQFSEQFSDYRRLSEQIFIALDYLKKRLYHEMVWAFVGLVCAGFGCFMVRLLIFIETYIFCLL